MKTQNAAGKTCPFMSKPLNAIHNNDRMYMPERLFFQYCLTTQCMAWTDTSGFRTEGSTGYCKLTEKDNYE